jgi:WD40 repeat protein
LAAGSGDDTVWLWDVHDPADPVGGRSLTGHTGGVNSVAFGGRLLVSGSDDDSALVCDLDLDDVTRHVCATTRGVLTPAQWQQYLPQSSYAPPC